MPTISYTAKAYPPGNPWGVINGTRTLNLSLPDLIHAAITVGHQDWHRVLGTNFAALAEIAWKASSTMLTIRQSGTAYRMTERFDGLDPSEKRGASYQLGLTLTKAFATKVLQVPWLMHIDVYKDQFSTPLGKSRSRPDLMGSTPGGQWVVFESKGRVSEPDDKALKKAKKQARRITSINGIPPTLKASLFTYFDRDDELCLITEDPIGSNKDDIPFQINKVTLEKLIQDYYAPFLQIFEPQTKIVDGQQAMARNLETDLKLEMYRPLFEDLQKQDYLSAAKHCQALAVNNATEFEIDGIKISIGRSWDKFKK